MMKIDPVFSWRSFNSDVSCIGSGLIDRKLVIVVGLESGECGVFDFVSKIKITTIDNSGNTEGSKLGSCVACGTWSNMIWRHLRGNAMQFFGIGPIQNCATLTHSIAASHRGFCAARIFKNLAAVPSESSDHQDVIQIFSLTEGGSCLLHTILLDQSSISFTMPCCLTFCDQNMDDDLTCLIAVGNGDGRVAVFVWDDVTNECRGAPQIVTVFSEPVTALAFDKSAERIFCTSPGRIVRTIALGSNPDNNRIRAEMENASLELMENGLKSVKIRSDNKLLAVSGSSDGLIRLYSVKSLKFLVDIEHYRSSVVDLDFVNDLKTNKIYIISASCKVVAIWDLYN